MHSLPNWRVLVPFLIALIAGLVVAWSSSAASDPATTANATRGSIAVVGNGLYRRFPDGRLALLTEEGRAPAWSHDGRQIAFVRLIDTGLSRVCPLFDRTGGIISPPLVTASHSRRFHSFMFRSRCDPDQFKFDSFVCFL